MADKKNSKPLSDTDLLTKVEAKVRSGVGWFDSVLSKERERAIKFYNSELPARQNPGRSSYVSSDVYDSVESLKAQLLETFAGNADDLISFPAQNEQDVQACRIATEYTNYQIFRLNDGYKVFSAAIHDGLMARIGVTKVFWEKIEEEIEETIPPSPMEAVLALSADPRVIEVDANETGDNTGIFSGKLKRRVDKSKVTLLPVPPEEYIVSRQAKSPQTADMNCHRTLKTKAELKKEGYDPKKVDEINWSDARSLDLTDEVITRNKPVSDSTAPTDDEALQPDLQKVMLYETYLMIDADGTGVRLWKVCHAGNVLLDKEPVDRIPFIVFVPLPVPHILHGNNFAQRVFATQNARTVLIRGILDHTAITTNPRWGVVKGGLLNPKEMLEQKLGGIVNLTRPDAVQALEYPQLNQYVFPTLEMLKQNKEESTGISSLSQGLNKDAVSNQNSQGLVQDLVGLSQTRQKIIARNFAYDYLIPLYLEVYRLVLENEKAERVVELAGDFKPISVESWIERTECKVALHLGFKEREVQASTIGNTYTAMAQDPSIAQFFTPQNRYTMLTDGMKAKGMENWANYLTSPDKVPPPQPDPLKMKELEIKEMTAKAALMQAEAAQGKVQVSAMAEERREMIKELTLHMENVFKTRDADRKDADTANRIDVAQREIHLLETAPPEAQNAIVSPNS